MELALYLLLVISISVGSFWFLGTPYGLFRRPAIYFPLSLAAKMAISAVLGGIFSWLAVLFLLPWYLMAK